MRGFVRILEAFIASIILFVSMTYFFSISSYSFWNAATVRATATDTMRSLYFSNVLNASIYNGDTTPVNNVFSRLLPGTIEYTFAVKGIPPPYLHIHCVCTTMEADAIQSRLGGTFIYKNRPIQILMSANPDITKVDRAANLILFTSFSSVQGNKPLIMQWLSLGRNVMIFSSLSQADFLSDNDNILGGIFGLTWQSGTGGGGTAGFYSNDASTPSYRVEKYLRGSSTYNENEKFTFIVESGTELNRIAIDGNAIITQNTGGTDYSLVKTGNGAMWFAGYDADAKDIGGALINDDVNKLFRATLMLAEGETYHIKDGSPPTKQTYFMNTLPGSVDGDPYIMTILIWNVFY